MITITCFNFTSASKRINVQLFKFHILKSNKICVKIFSEHIEFFFCPRPAKFL